METIYSFPRKEDWTGGHVIGNCEDTVGSKCEPDVGAEFFYNLSNKDSQ